MPCYYPLQAVYGAVKRNGKRKVEFDEEKREAGAPFQLPCGRCIGCRLERSRQWAMRITHEASLYDRNCFLTLTYDDEHLPGDRSLDKRHFQLFMKRLRKLYPSQAIRYFHCGEYGTETRRPHYHACIFNFDFADKKFFKKSGEHSLFTSELLDKLWGFGFCQIGSLTFESAAYVARYIVDKIDGPLAAEHYTDKDTGVVLTKEYVTMSRRPGIGSQWFDKFKSDVYPGDSVIMRGKPMRPPKFYDSKLESDDLDTLVQIKDKRLDKAKLYANDQTPERLMVREKVRQAMLNLFKRS